MTITAQSNWRKQTLTESQFVQRARDRWPAYVLADNDPAWAYGRCVHHRVDANLVLEIFDHESSSGRAGTALETHSAGNTREPTFGDVPKVEAGAEFPVADWRRAYGKPDTTYYVSKFGQAQGRSGFFARFRNWREGWEGTVARLSADEWAYAKLRTIAEVIETWAPRADMNDPNRYTEAVVAGMNRNMQIGGDVATPQIAIPGVTVEWKPADSRHYTAGRTHKVKQIVHHHTDGWNSLTWLTTSPSSNVSAHFLVSHDGSHIWQLVRLEDTAHTQGNHNPWSVGIEWERKWPDQRDVPESAYQTLAALDLEIRGYIARNKLGVFSLNRTGVKRHDEVNDTSCPQNLDVDRISNMARDLIEVPDPPDTPSVPTLPPTVPEPNRDNNPWNQQRWIPEPFMENIDEYPWWVTGWAVSEAFLEDGKLVQYFERARLELDNAGNVTRGLVGWEAMVARYPERRR